MKKTITAFLLFTSLFSFAQNKAKWKEPVTTERFTFGYFQKNELNYIKFLMITGNYGLIINFI